MPVLFQPLQRGPGVLYGACGGIWVMLLVAPPVVGDMHLARPALRAMTERHPAGFPTLTWVLPRAGFSMDAESRKVAATITTEFDLLIMAQATLIEGIGFQAAAVRAIVAGIDMMTRSRAPRKVFEQVRPSVAWCLPLRPSPGEATAPEAEISAAIEARRQTFG